jgi:D-arabinose 1-dehydrogenase-like Zn-dependent alcohol dehydrogenase
MIRLLQTIGEGHFFETTFYDEPLGANEIKVNAIMTGVCRSDIDMMNGEFGLLPSHMQGHEGIGQVFEIGADVTDVKIGDYVATRGEPAYADQYKVRYQEYVTIPQAHPRYILEPVACGVNIILQARKNLELLEGDNKKLLIIGSGFLAWVAYNTIKTCNLDFEIDVIGSSNRELWQDTLVTTTASSYDVVIDLSGKYELGTVIELCNGALIIDAVGKAVSKKEAQAQLWKACTTIHPSPRTLTFYTAMVMARDMVESKKIIVDSFWTKCYNRNTEWQQAFADGKNRPTNYNRGYIKWD